MLPQDLKPHWSRHDGHILLNYEVPDRIYDASIYPLASPNGSKILLFGHQQGMTVIWKGGSRTLNANTHANGDDHDDVFADDQRENTLMRDRDADAQFTAEDDFDLEDSTDPIVDVYNYSSNSPVVHIASAPIPSDKASHVVDSVPIIFSSNIVVALAHLDGSLRLITLPLLPPSLAPNSNQTEARMVTPCSELVIVPERSAIQQMCRGLAITWTSRSSTAVNDSKNGTSNGPQDQTSKSFRNWSILVAAHNAEAASSLSVYEAPLVGNGDSLDSSLQNIKPCQREQLPGLVNAMSFSPARFPSYRHSQLLIADIKGSVRIYDCLASAARLSSSATQDQEKGTLPGRGTWLTTFYTNYTNEESNLLSLPRRKRILSVEWAFNGQCVAALLEDGEWGIWDIEGAGPRPSTGTSEDTAFIYNAALSGGGVTSFALHGFIGAGVNNATRDGHEPRNKDRRKLAPMTPKTRKVKQENLFAENLQKEVSKVQLRGGISISPAAPSVESGYAHDESLALWFGGSVFYVPSLLNYWQKALSRSVGRFGSNRPGSISGLGLTRLAYLSAQGEQVTTVAQSTRRMLSAPSPLEPNHDVLLVAEHRFLLLCPLTRELRSSSGAKNLSAGDSIGESSQSLEVLDQQLLNRGELSLGGLDRLLDGLDHQRLKGNLQKPVVADQPGHGKSVGFAAMD